MGDYIAAYFARLYGCLIVIVLALLVIAFAVGYLASGCNVKIQSPVKIQAKENP